MDTFSTGTPTVLAPTHAAFAALRANKPQLTAVLGDHVLSALWPKAEVPVGAEVKTVQGNTLMVNTSQQITDLEGRRSQTTATDALPAMA